MTADQLAPLSDFERRVYETIERHSPNWVSFAQISGETGLPPDIVMRILLVLTESKLIKTNREAPLKQVEVGATRPD